MYDLASLQEAADLVHSAMLPTAQHCWPLLCERVGAEVWVKHENHTATGAFKVRGGIVYFEELSKARPEIRGVLAATTGNHGQSVAVGARRTGLEATIVVPLGNSPEKNAAMRGFGATLIEHGRDFNEALDFAVPYAEAHGLHMYPSYHEWLVLGVASYALELLTAVPDLEVVYVPVGMGSGICGMMAARDALGLKIEIVGVVSDLAPTYALSFAQAKPVPTNSADTFAAGLAVRVPDERALDLILAGTARIVSLSEEELADAVRHYQSDTHNMAEGAGAAGLAALMKERQAMAGKRVGVVLSGGNIDRGVYVRILSGQSPR